MANLGPGHGGFKNIREIQIDEAAMGRAPGGETAVIEETVMVVLAILVIKRKNNRRNHRR